MASSPGPRDVSASVRQALLGGLMVALGGGLGWLLFGRVAKADIVFVKTNEVMSRYKGAMQVREAFQKDTAAWGEEAKQLEAKLQELVKGGRLNDPKVREEGTQLRGRLEALRQKGARRDQELMAPVLAEVNASIKRFAERHGYRLIVGTLGGGVVLHGDEKLDVTEALLAEMNK